MSVIVNGIEWNRLPGQAYYRPYDQIFQRVKNGELPELDVIRDLILKDLFFIVYFIMGIKKANHPFVIARCREAQERLNKLYANDLNEPKRKLNVWSRGHYKTSICTIATTVQKRLREPDKCTCIFSFKKPAAEDFVESIKAIYEMEIMKACFPDRLYEKTTESPSWSVQNGITIKRSNASRKEATVESSGLVEGMVIGKHFEDCIFEDIETKDICQSPENMKNCLSSFEMARYLGTGNDDDTQEINGTYYHHNGPLISIRDKKDQNDKSIYAYTCYPGTEDGTAMGKPVLLSEKKMEEERTGEHFAAQILCDPTPQSDMKLNPEYLQEIDPQFIPKNLFKVVIVDPAGDKDNVKTKNSDSWAIGQIGFEYSGDSDDWGVCGLYLLDACIEKLSEPEAIDEITRMYLLGGRIMTLAIEKRYGELIAFHVLEALKKKGRRLTEANHSFMWLRDAGRYKKDRITKALTWPLNNGKIFISTAVPVAYRDRIKTEMEKFPVWHDDALDMLSYAYDIMKEDWAIRGIQSIGENVKVKTVGQIMDRAFANYEGGWG